MLGIIAAQWGDANYFYIKTIFYIKTGEDRLVSSVELFNNQILLNNLSPF